MTKSEIYSPRAVSQLQSSTSALSLTLTCALVFTIGAGLVFAAGFAHSSAIHDAAHDTRHSLAFPCH